MDDDILRLHALTNIAQASNPGYQINGDIDIGKFPVLLGRDTSILGLPSRLLGGIDAFFSGPSGYNSGGVPLLINARTYSLQSQEQVGIEAASIAILPTPGAPSGPGILRSGFAFGGGMTEQVATTVARVESGSLRLPNAGDELLTTISPETGEILNQVLQSGNKGRPPESFLESLKNAIFTHNHPSDGPIGFEDAVTGLVYGAKGVRAVGNNNTYALDINLPADSYLRNNFAQDVMTAAKATGKETLGQYPNFRSLPESNRVDIMSPKLNNFFTNLSKQYPDIFKYSVTPTKR